VVLAQALIWLAIVLAGVSVAWFFLRAMWRFGPFTFLALIALIAVISGVQS